MEILNYQVSDGQSGIRIDRYLSEMNEELSRSYIQKLLKEHRSISDRVDCPPIRLSCFGIISVVLTGMVEDINSI